ncbi:unnamed protein product [Caenorhabditis bovis]|uniref:glutathione transferase n=1 Tax=Caenorhabditis bovis TaxID=2654633 RepID=A0A8S1EW43_9PELO|nr:unnamed protein product [Caenorhabditis bovis]
MPEYKLYYFNGRGLGDVSRQLFALAGEKFEDVRVSSDDWPNLKKEMPFGQMPVLEVDGVKIPQSMAIARYLAKKFGYAGKTDYEQAIVDAFADQFKDFYIEAKTYYYTKLGLMDKDPEEEKKNALIPARDKFLPLIAKYLKQSKSGFLVDSGVTYADLIIVDNMRTLISLWPEYLKDYPEIKAWYDKVDSIPQIRKHLENSPNTGF